MPLVVFQSTNSASWAGLAFFVESLPRFLAFPLCGALCDKFSPIRILHISQVYRALLCLLAVALYGNLRRHRLAGGVVALCGVLTTQGIMAREVLMPYVFLQHYSYTKTLSYPQIADQTGLVLGAVGGAAAGSMGLALGGAVRRRAVRAGRPEHAGVATLQPHHP